MKLLVAAASKHQATWEIAEAIGRALVDSGADADVRRVEDLDGVEGYDALVLGSAVYVGSWMDSAKTFVAEHASRLRSMPVWLFSSGPLGDPPHPNDEHAVNVDEVLAATGAREHRLFAGRLDKGRLGFGERAVVLAVRAPEGDYRDWKAITTWARSIVAGLSTAA